MRHSGWRMVAGLILLSVVAAGCTDDGERRVAFDDVLDPEVELPDGLTGVELPAEMEVFTDARQFCSVAAEIPLRWFGDALLSTQVSVDAYGAALDVPAAAQEPIERLVEFGETWLEWTLGSGGDRPPFDEELQADVVTVANAALEHCPDLPLVIGPPESAARPGGWSDMTDEEVADHCADMGEDLDGSLAEYEAITGEPPRHSIQLDAVLPYSASDWFGVAHDAQTGSRVVPVPGGACDVE